MPSKMLYFLLIIAAVQACNSENSSEKGKRLSIEYLNDDIRIKGAGIDLRADFSAPELVSSASEKPDWKPEGSGSAAMTFGNEEGEVRTDTYFSVQGRLERRTWISGKKDLVAFQHVYTNTTGAETRLKYLYPLHLTGGGKLFSNKGPYRILTQDTQKNGIPGTASSAGEKIIKSDPFIVINDPETNENLFIGSQTFYLHLFEIRLQFNPEGSQEPFISAECICNFEGVRVPPGSSRESQWIVIRAGTDPNRLIAGYTERTGSFHPLKKQRKRPPSVYSAFYYHGLGYNEEYFRSDVDAFRKNPLPFDVFQIDACWQQNYGHDFEYNGKVFPSGMKHAAEQISSLGYVPGIWTAPYIVKIKSETSLAKTHPEWLVRNSKGELCTWIDSYYILDPTYPGVTDYLEESYRKLAADWGYKYFKFDFMRTIFLDADQQFYDRTSTSLEAYRKGLEAIRRGVGESSYILVCGGHYGASLGIADGQRSGSDTRSMWNTKELPKYRQNILRTWMSAFWDVDPDAMMVRRQSEPLPTGGNLTLGLFTDDEARTNTLNQFIGGSLVCFAEDFAKIDDDRRALYRHIIPSVNSSSVPVDIFDPVCPNMMLTHVTPLCNTLPGWNILSVVNWSDSTRNYEIALDELMTAGLKENKYVISEFFSKQVIGVFRKNQVLILNDVQPHQSKVLRIMPWNGKDPVLAGTDLHFSGGGVEISKWKNNGGKIEGSLDTPWKYPVNITVVFPSKDEKGFRTKSVQLPEDERDFSIDAEL